MKILFIESSYRNQDISLSQKQILKLPKSIFLAYSLQYKALAEKIKKQLEENNIKIIEFQQVLGCSKIKTTLPILLISSGRFHAQNLMFQTKFIFWKTRK
jgi:diphthamide biosynthesis enzyme Dph1/Dph2-like protein